MTASQQLIRQFAGRKVVPEIFEVVNRLTEMFGNDLDIIELNGGFLNFRIGSWADRTLIRHLEQHQSAIFPHGVGQWQVLCPWGTEAGRGIFLHHLPSISARRNYRSGFWYY